MSVDNPRNLGSYQRCTFASPKRLLLICPKSTPTSTLEGMDLLTGYGSDASDEPGSPAAAPPSAQPSAGGGLPTGFFDSLPTPSQPSAGPSSAAARSVSGAAAGPSGLPSDFFGGAALKASAKPRPAAPSNGAGPSLLGKLPAPKTGKSNVVSFRPPIDLSKLAADDDVSDGEG